MWDEEYDSGLEREMAEHDKQTIYEIQMLIKCRRYLDKYSGKVGEDASRAVAVDIDKLIDSRLSRMVG